MNGAKTTAAVILLTAAVSLAADYPEILRLSNSDILFRQFHEDISRFNRESSRGGQIPPLMLYRYTPGGDENIFTVASRFTIPYDSIATLNGIERSTIPVAGKPLLIPNVPGIFLRDRPRTHIERLLHSWREPSEGLPVSVGGELFYFFPDGRLHPVERAFFLDILFFFPLEAADITSRYGTRISPISGRIHFHNGLDLAAPRGSRVFAARDGRVITAGNDPVLGLHVILSHAGGYETLYGHLDSIAVELDQIVTSGRLLGRVGSTGASTGAHLHFEVRKQGEARDPEILLPRRIRP